MGVRLLLDTQVLLWLLTAPERIPTATLQVVRDPATSLLVSAASAWELATKHRMGRLPEATALVEGYAEHLARLQVAELPVTSPAGLLAGSLAWKHRDPFDRMIVAQAMLDSLPVVSADSVISEFPGIRVHW